MTPRGRFSSSGGHALAFVVAVAVSLLSALPASAKSVKIDKQTVELANRLCVDREAAFAQEPCMTDEEFQSAWSFLVGQLDEKFEGKNVRIGKFGSQIRVRQQFTLLGYVTLRSQTKGQALDPPFQEVAARHPFLQMLMTEGSCYTRDDRYPKKMADFLVAYPQMALMLRQHLDAWDQDHRKAFDESFPINAANAIE